jgi:acyl-CoA thioester hydrolase
MEEFRFNIPYTVRISDINYGGHVSNAAVLSYFQDARIAYLQQLGSFSEMDIGGCGIILPEANVRYRAEMFLGDQLEIGVRIDELRRLSYRIERNGEVTAEGTTGLVAFDYSQRKVQRLPEAFCRAVKAFEEMP